MTEKREKFLEIGEGRMNRAIKAISLLSNFSSNRKEYEFDDEDVKKMVGALRSAVETVETNLMTRKPNGGFKF